MKNFQYRIKLCVACLLFFLLFVYFESLNLYLCLDVWKMPMPCINPQTKYWMQQEFPTNVLDDEYLALISQEHLEQKKSEVLEFNYYDSSINLYWTDVKIIPNYTHSWLQTWTSAQRGLIKDHQIHFTSDLCSQKWVLQ